MKRFFELIDRLNDAAAYERHGIERELLAGYQCQKAVLALDMSGFSLAVRRSGIVSYLCCIRRMQQLMEPLVARSGGELVKFEADNLLAVFDHPRDAVAAAVAMNRAAIEARKGTGEVELAVAVGIDFGPILLIPGQDCFGDAVNIAFKLGEDVARPGEALITRTAGDQLGEPHRLEALELSISGLQIPAYRVIQA